MNEEWKPIAGLEGLYEVSNLGRVKSIRSNKIMTPRMLRIGYARVTLPLKTGRRDCYIHRLVAEAFCFKPEGCNVVNHIDFDKRNNKASNLEWTTQKENVFHSMRNDRMKGFPKFRSVIGTKDNEEKTYATVHEAALATGCDHSMITKCCKGKNHSTHGFTWRYAEVIV